MHPGDRKLQQKAHRPTKMSCWTKQDWLHINIYNLQLLVHFSCLPVLASRRSNSSHQTVLFSKLTSVFNIWKISFFDLGWETESSLHERNVLRKPSLGFIYYIYSVRGQQGLPNALAASRWSEGATAPLSGAPGGTLKKKRDPTSPTPTLTNEQLCFRPKLFTKKVPHPFEMITSIPHKLESLFSLMG